MRIVLTGGGTGGHVIPNVAILEELIKRIPNENLLYIGSKKGPEREHIKRFGIEFKSVQCGKLRRYLSLKNLVDFARMPIGILQARRILKKFKPDKVFSKGGYVSVPVVIAARMLKIPVILHESDLSPGLANRISARFADKICVSFKESKKYFQKKEVIVTGNPVRQLIFNGGKENGFKLTGFDSDKPIVLVMGGSSGAQELNDLVYSSLPVLLRHCHVAHITGRGKGGLDNIKGKLKGYKQFEYLNDELADLYAITDLVVTRAGANTLAEISALGLPSVLVPLSTKASRGDQVENAKLFEEKEMAIYLKEDSRFAQTITTALKHLDSFKCVKNNAVEKIVALLT